jgi:hypothetical protein
MTDDDGVFVYDAAQLIPCRVEIMCSALDIFNRQTGKAGVQVADQGKKLNSPKQLSSFEGLTGW